MSGRTAAHQMHDNIPSTRTAEARAGIVIGVTLAIEETENKSKGEILNDKYSHYNLGSAHYH